MEEQYQRHNSRAWFGIALIVGGGLLFARRMGAPIPHWLFSWEVLLIALGLLIGIKHRFRKSSWIVPVAVGGYFLSERLMPEWDLHLYMLPAFIILVGLVFLLRPKKKCRGRFGRFADKEQWKEQWREKRQRQYDSMANPDADYLDSVSFFGGVKKIILSKNFKGGEVTCFMGGAEIDLSQADIQQQIILDLTNVFGGTKLIVPPHWDVKSEVTAIFGGIDDKRPVQSSNIDREKVLILKGIAVFGGIDIRSY